MNTKRQAFVLLITASLGVVVSIKLLVHHIDVTLAFSEGPSGCVLGEKFDCDKVASSPLSKILGIPVAALGVGFFIFQLFVSAWYKPERALYTVLGGALFSLFYAFQSFFIIGSVCIYCSMLYALSIFQLFYFLRSASIKQAFTAFFSDIRFSEFLLPMLTSFLIAVCLPGALLKEVFLAGETLEVVSLLDKQVRSRSSVPEEQKSQLISEFESQPVQINSLPDESFIKGGSEGALELQIFSDFQCPACREAASDLDLLIKDYEGKLRIAYRHFPLDSSCNSGAHEYACELALLSICAGLEGGGDSFWELHDFIFSFPSFSDETIEELANSLGQQVKGCTQGEKAKALLEEDIKLGRSAGLRGTPTLFLDGKLVPSRRPQFLRTIFDYQLQGKRD